jgi:hypothetical protein
VSPTDERDAFDRGYLTAKVELLERKLDVIGMKVDGLTSWKALVTGLAAAVSMVVSLVIAWWKGAA